MIRVIDHVVLNDLYTWGDKFEEGYVKVVDNEITELYVDVWKLYGDTFYNIDWKARPEIVYLRLDIETMQAEEYYTYETVNGVYTERKYSMTDELLQENHLIDGFENLPQNIKEHVDAWPERDKIYSWSENPYGLVVEVLAS